MNASSSDVDAPANTELATPAKSTPRVAPCAVAVDLFPSLRVFASTTTAPDPSSVAPDPTVVVMSAPEPIEVPSCSIEPPDLSVYDAITAVGGEQ